MYMYMYICIYPFQETPTFHGNLLQNQVQDTQFHVLNLHDTPRDLLSVPRPMELR